MVYEQHCLKKNQSVYEDRLKIVIIIIFNQTVSLHNSPITENENEKAK